MSLFDGILEQYNTPTAPATAAKTTAPGYILTIKRISNGEEIYLCSSHPAPESALIEAQKQGRALFTLAEIPYMQQAVAADPQILDIIIATKRLYPGCEITKCINEAVCPGA